jgi:predicted HTH domain antitoxin
MNITLDIPESVIGSLRVPEGEIQARLKMELAITLYAQGLLSFGKASDLAELDRFSFSDLVTTRGIQRHYGAEELAEDFDYAHGE